MFDKHTIKSTSVEIAWLRCDKEFELHKRLCSSLLPINTILPLFKFRALQTKIKAKDVNHFSGLEIASLLSNEFSRKVERCMRLFIMVFVLLLITIMGVVTILSLSLKDTNVVLTEISNKI